MKTTKSLAVVLCVSATVFSAKSQGFVNLDFGSAQLSGYTSGSFVPASDAIPGWNAYLGASEQTTVLYNSLALGSANVAILDVNNGYPPFVIPGNTYTVVLQAGYGGVSEYVSTSIAQTAVIPANAKSIAFTASFPYGSGWQVSINGQIIPVIETSEVNSLYAVYEGNISAFAGVLDDLEFTALTGPGPSVNMYLDSISFSPSPVPEPNSLGLFALGGLLVAWRHWRRNSA